MVDRSKRTEELAYEKGYRVTEDGVLLGVHGKPIVASNASEDGRLQVTFRHEGGRIAVAVHILQAYQKYGKELYKQGIEVRHKDNRYLNNSWGNILIGTKSQNEMDKDPEVRKAAAKKAAAVLRKLTDVQVDQLRNDRLEGATYKELAVKYRLANSTISYIVNRKTYIGA